MPSECIGLQLLFFWLTFWWLLDCISAAGCFEVCCLQDAAKLKFSEGRDYCVAEALCRMSKNHMLTELTLAQHQQIVIHALACI